MAPRGCGELVPSGCCLDQLLALEMFWLAESRRDSAHNSLYRHTRCAAPDLKYSSWGLTQCTLAVSKCFEERFGPTGLNPTFEPRNDEIEAIGEFFFLLFNLGECTGFDE